MPLIEYLGNATPQDNTEFISLHDDDNGNPRSIKRGGRALVSGTELRALAANYEVRVLEDSDESDPDVIPTKMPSGYDENGYKEGEVAGGVVFGPDEYPDPKDTDGDGVPDGKDTTFNAEAETNPASSPASAASAASSPSTPAASPAPASSPSSAPAPSSQPSTSPASPGTSG